MAVYTLNAGETHALVDQSGAPVPFDTTPFTGFDGAVITVAYNAARNLEVHGVAPGTSALTLTRDGTAVTRTITVTPAPFDWSVGPLA